MKNLYFIRHGQSVMNVLSLCSGTEDTPLTEQGIQQAIDAGEKIKASGVSFDSILCSPKTRAKVTAQKIADAVGFPISKIEYFDDLQERDFGILEGKNMTTMLGLTPEYYYANPRCIDDVEGVETIADLHTRAERLIAYVRNRPEESILLVSHGALLRSIQRVLQNLPYDSPLLLSDNATLIKLV